MMQLIYNTLRGYLPYTKDRRNQAKRILGWAIAFSCWIPLVWVWLACCDDLLK